MSFVESMRGQIFNIFMLSLMNKKCDILEYFFVLF